MAKKITAEIRLSIDNEGNDIIESRIDGEVDFWILADNKTEMFLNRLIQRQEQGYKLDFKRPSEEYQREMRKLKGD